MCSVSEGRWAWRYQRGNKIPYIEEQTTQWPEEKEQNDKCHQWDSFISYLPLQRSQKDIQRILLWANIYYLNVVWKHSMYGKQKLIPPYFGDCYMLDFQRYMSWSFSFNFQLFVLRDACLFCWYWWNSWLFKLSFHDYKRKKCRVLRGRC
jgi:hypothetical protein